MMYYLEKWIKMNLPSILLKYLKELIKETRDGVIKLRKWIPKGGFISNILVERQLVKELTDLNVTTELYTKVRKPFNGITLKHMQLVAEPVGTSDLDREAIYARRVPIKDYPLFTEEGPP